MHAPVGRTRRIVPVRVRKALRILGLVLVLAFGVLGGPGARPAAAHAYLTACSPADGESLAAAPTRLRLEFSEHVVPESARIVLTDASGRARPVTNLRAEAENAAPSSREERVAGVVDAEEPLAVVADLPDLPDGAYHVTWETLSRDDLHRTAGGFAFGVNTAVVADSAGGITQTPPDLGDALWRAAVLAGLGLALGAGIVSRLPGARDQRFGLTRVGVTAALGAAVAGAAGFALELAKVGGSAVSGSYAARWGLREAALLLLALALARRARPVWAGVAGLVASVATVLLGHTGLRGGIAWTVASTIHVWAGAAWCGAVVIVAWIALRHRRSGPAPGDVRAVLRGFFGPAAVLVAAVAVTGLYLAGDTVVSVDAALGTVYGRVLLVKVLLSVAIGLLAGWTARRLHPRRGHPHAPPEDLPGKAFAGSSPRAADGAADRPVPRHAVTLEAAGLGIALLLAALLASGGPAISPALVDRTGPAPSLLLDRTVDDLQETVDITPNRPGGDSVVTVDVFDARRPSPGPVTGVSVSVPGRPAGTGAAPVAAHPLGDHRWAAGVRLRAPGPTPVSVTVHRQGMPATVTTFDWVVGPATPAAAPVVSRAPISGLLQLGSLCLLAAVLLLGAGVAWRRRTEGPRPAVPAPGTDPSVPSAERPVGARTS